MAVTNKSYTDALIKDDWITPVKTVREIERETGIIFDVDVAGSLGNRKAPVVICDEHWWRVNPHINALATDWSKLGRYAFMNPPFSLKLKFIRQAEQMACKHVTTVGIVPVALCAGWWKEMEQGCSEILIPDKRIQYIHPITGKVMKAPNFESAVVIWKPKTSINYGRIVIGG